MLFENSFLKLFRKNSKHTLEIQHELFVILVSFETFKILAQKENNFFEFAKFKEKVKRGKMNFNM